MFCQVWICGLKNKTKKVGPLELGGKRWMDGGRQGEGQTTKSEKNGKTRCDFLTE